MRSKLRLLVVLASLTGLSACFTAPQVSPLPALMECPRPGPELLQPVPALPPIPTRATQTARAPASLPMLPPNWRPPTPTWPSGSPPPASSTKPAAHA